MSKGHIILESGSCYTRAGFAGDQHPKVIERTVVGKGESSSLVGNAALQAPTLSQPVQNGQIKNWDGIEKLWRHVLLDKLKVDPKEYNIMLLDTPVMNKDDRKTMAQILFEKFGFPAIHIANQAVLTIYSTGRSEGIVLETGDGSVCAAPCLEGFVVPSAITCLGFGGNTQTHFLSEKLSEKGHDLSSKSETVREIKEKMCYTADDYNKETSNPEVKKEYKLEDGQSIALGCELFQTSEVLFQPSLAGIPSPNVARILSEAISKFCDPAKQKMMFENISLGGGVTMNAGFPERLQKEVQALAPEGQDVRVLAMPHRAHSAWCGGSILASLDAFHTMWVTAAEYQEKGIEIVYEKCK